MNLLNLHGMDAPHAFKSHGARSFAPAQQALRIRDVAVNRIDRLNVRRMSRVHYSLAGVQRFTTGRRLHHSEVGGVVFKSNGESGDAVRSGRDGEGVLDA